MRGIRAAIPTPQGVDTVIWKIGQLVFNYITDTVQLTMVGYLSEKENVEPIMGCPQFQITNISAKSNPTHEDLYKAVMAEFGKFPDDHELVHLKPLSTGELVVD